MSGSLFAELGAIAEQRWGMFTTEQAEQAGVHRKQLSRLASSGALERVRQGVYRMAGAPQLENEEILATWLALGGATLAPMDAIPAVVAAGQTAAILHGIGDFYPDVTDFIVPIRRTTRIPAVKLRVAQLTPQEVTFADGVPVLTVERTVADLVERWTDRSLVADTLGSAAEQGKLTSRARLERFLDPMAHAHGASSGAELAVDLFELAGLTADNPRG